MKWPNDFRPRMSDEDFDAYLQICQELYTEMAANGTWLWNDDSQNPEDLLESKEP